MAISKVNLPHRDPIADLKDFVPKLQNPGADIFSLEQLRRCEAVV